MIFEIKTSGYNRSYSYLNLLYNVNQLQVGIAKGFKYCVQIFINGYNRADRLLITDNCTSGIIAGYIPILI